MNTMFSNLTPHTTFETDDYVVGTAKEKLPTDVYDAVIKVAYGIQAASGAKGVTLVMVIQGREIKLTEYVTNRQGSNVYSDKEGNKKFLPSFSAINQLCLLTTGIALKDQNLVEKTIKEYSYTSRSDELVKVPVIEDLLNKPFKVALVQQMENKRVSHGSQYVATGEFYTTYKVDKYMNAQGKTYNEYNSGSEAEFMGKWLAVNKGVIRDKREIKEEPKPSGTSSLFNTTPSTPSVAPPPAPVSSLFG